MGFPSLGGGFDSHHSLHMQYAFYRYKSSYIKIGHESDLIFSIKLTDEIDSSNTQTKITDSAFSQLKEYFLGRRKTFDLPIAIQGTTFQQKVYTALQQLNYGETTTYKALAAKVGSPKAFRAVGSACHSNPLWIVVPCHRVLGSNKKLVGYAGGLEMKDSLLNLEKSTIQSEKTR